LPRAERRSSPAAERHPETDEFFLVLSGELTIKINAGDVVSSPPNGG
jgi:hypothetical protein